MFYQYNHDIRELSMVGSSNMVVNSNTDNRLSSKNTQLFEFCSSFYDFQNVKLTLLLLPPGFLPRCDYVRCVLVTVASLHVDWPVS